MLSEGALFESVLSEVLFFRTEPFEQLLFETVISEAILLDGVLFESIFLEGGCAPSSSGFMITFCFFVWDGLDVTEESENIRSYRAHKYPLL